MIIGYNDVDFQGYVSSVKAMGETSGAYRDLNLAFVTSNGRHHTIMDLLNLFRPEAEGEPYSNTSFLWPAITYLSTYLRSRGLSVDYVNSFQRDKEALRNALKAGTVLSVAITTTLYVWSYPIIEIVEMIRAANPATKIIIGGPYIDNQSRLLDREDMLTECELLDCDVYVISAEGEAALANVVSAIRDGRSLHSIENLIFKDGNEFVETARSAEKNSLADNMVDYALFHDDCNGFVNLRTAKSCPFKCSFCAFPTRAGGYTYLPIELVERELDAVSALGAGLTLSFIDDTFNVPKKRFKEILRLMVQKGYGFSWNSFLRSDHADEECIDLMRQSGCEGVFLGAESGSDTMLTAMNKTARRADYVRVIGQLRDAGITSYASLIVGFPGETEDTLAETMDFIETARPDFYRAQLWYCDPLTPVWNDRDALGIVGSGFAWSHQTMTAQTAADWVERFFLDIRGSTWLPQYGFEMWSLFYLQRRGMSMPQIKSFIEAFNEDVSVKIRDRSKRELSREALERLRGLCTFTEDRSFFVKGAELAV
jgi:radical SAM PhpK family P-methyltransferase